MHLTEAEFDMVTSLSVRVHVFVKSLLMLFLVLRSTNY